MDSTLARRWNRAPSGQARLASLQEEFRREERRRVDQLIDLIRESIETNDAFRVNAHAPPEAQRDFGDSTTERYERYLAWVRDAIRAVILVETGREAVHAGRHYTAPWVRTAYQRGISFAEDQLEQGDAPLGSLGGVGASRSLLSVTHSDALEMRYGRTYDQLEAIADGMGQSQSRVVADILEVTAEVTAEKAAERLVEPIEHAYSRRVQALTRFETMDAFTSAMFTTYEQAEVEEIVGFAEYRTAGDSHVCPVCAGYHGQRMSISRARDLLPQHPGCRCVAIPAI